MSFHPPLKVASYNIGSVLDEVRRSRAFELLERDKELSGMDVLCLQEVYLTNAERESETKSILHKHFPYAIFGENAQFDDGCMGNVVLSKLPISKWENFDLSIKGREPRGCLRATIKFDDYPRTHFLNLHLGLRASERARQFEFLFSYIELLPSEDPIVLVGDFNDWKGSLHSMTLKKGIFLDVCEHLKGRLSRTFPSIFPLLPLDRIYQRQLEPLSFKRHTRGWKGVSDHLPISAGLTF